MHVLVFVFAAVTVKKTAIKLTRQKTQHDVSTLMSVCPPCVLMHSCKLIFKEPQDGSQSEWNVKDAYSEGLIIYVENI